MKLVPMAICAVLVASCLGPASSLNVTPEQRLREKFRDHVDDYMDLRHDAVAASAALEPTDDPAALLAARKALSGEIRRRRPDAHQGAIFSSDIRSYFRKVLAPLLRGETGPDIRFKLEDDAPDPGAVPLEVNAAYPAGLPFPTTPLPVLAALPSLPVGLAYRIIGRDLILLDQPADLIVDYMRNALPAAQR
jgi:hypothetical protein